MIQISTPRHPGFFVGGCAAIGFSLLIGACGSNGEPAPVLADASTGGSSTASGGGQASGGLRASGSSNGGVSGAVTSSGASNAGSGPTSGSSGAGGSGGGVVSDGGNASGGVGGKATAGSAGAAGGASVDFEVYLLAGQSNMDGRAPATDLTAAQRIPSDTVSIYYRYLPFASDTKAFTTDGFTALMPGFSVPPSYTGSLPSTTFGPEIGFAATMRQAQPSIRLALIKGSHGGTSLVNHWRPGTMGQSDTQGVCYREFLNTLAMAKTALQKDGHSFAIRGLLWHQGESDVDAGVTQAAYTDMLSTFITRIREDVGDATLPIAVGEVYEDGTRGAIRAAQRQVATTTPHVGFVSADGLVTLDAGTHFDASSQLTLGKRFADAMSTLVGAPE